MIQDAMPSENEVVVNMSDALGYIGIWWGVKLRLLKPPFSCNQYPCLAI